MREYNLQKANGTVMGGPWQIIHVDDTAHTPQKIARTAYSALFEIEQQMSHFLKSSFLMQLNARPVGQWLKVPVETLETFNKAQEISHQTDGALCIGLGEHINAWGFGSIEVDESMTINSPKHQTDDNASQELGFSIDWQACSIQRTADIQFNLAAIAKGYAVDYAYDTVKSLGVENFVIEAAGEIKVCGEKAPNVPWQVGLELPVPGQCLVYDHLDIQHGSALATSGSYRKYRTISGKHVCHAFDPKTQIPIDSKKDGDLLAVCVRNESCAYADAMATALFVMGAVDGSDFADKHNIAALFLLKDEQGVCEIRSREWMEMI